MFNCFPFSQYVVFGDNLGCSWHRAELGICWTLQHIQCFPSLNPVYGSWHPTLLILQHTLLALIHRCSRRFHQYLVKVWGFLSIPCLWFFCTKMVQLIATKLFDLFFLLWNALFQIIYHWKYMLGRAPIWDWGKWLHPLLSSSK